jgi:hypothetical protein
MTALTVQQKRLIWLMRSTHDTLQIAAAVGCSEAEVYNRIAACSGTMNPDRKDTPCRSSSSQALAAGTPNCAASPAATPF